MATTNFAIQEVQDFLIRFTNELGEAVHPDGPRGKKISPLEGLGLLISGGRFGSRIVSDWEVLKSQISNLSEEGRAELQKRFMEEFSLDDFDGDPENKAFIERGVEIHLNLLLELPQAVDWYVQLKDRRKNNSEKQ